MANMHVDACTQEALSLGWHEHSCATLFMLRTACMHGMHAYGVLDRVVCVSRYGVTASAV
jgi:hypothetical protein